MTYAKVIADSISPEGVRLVTTEVKFHRFVLAEMNTHRVFSRNSASSRAIPLAKQLKRVREAPATPVTWAAERKGMQGGDEIEGEPLSRAKEGWLTAAGEAAVLAEYLGAQGVHKSLANRLLEPFMWHTAVITSTSWENFFSQRCSPMAQPEIRVAAEMMREAMDASTPARLGVAGDRKDQNHPFRDFTGKWDWHLPYVSVEDIDESMAGFVPQTLAKISAARCARVSYLTQDGTRDTSADLALYERLTTSKPAHWSPLEHVATPWPENRQNQRPLSWDFAGGVSVGTDHLPRVGNLLGWRSLRTEVEAQQGEMTYR